MGRPSRVGCARRVGGGHRTRLWGRSTVAALGRATLVSDSDQGPRARGARSCGPERGADPMKTRGMETILIVSNSAVFADVLSSMVVTAGFRPSFPAGTE